MKKSSGSDENGANGADNSASMPQSSGNVVYFAFDSFAITPEAQNTIDAYVSSCSANVPLYVEGHCDSRGTKEYNLSLGEKRANAVKAYLQGKGITREIVVISYGKERLVDMGTDAEAHAKNRRAEMKTDSSK